jgi:hypothetical protein
VLTALPALKAHLLASIGCQRINLDFLTPTRRDSSIGPIMTFGKALTRKRELALVHRLRRVAGGWANKIPSPPNPRGDPATKTRMRATDGHDVRCRSLDQQSAALMPAVREPADGRHDGRLGYRNGWQFSVQLPAAP